MNSSRKLTKDRPIRRKELLPLFSTSHQIDIAPGFLNHSIFRERLARVKSFQRGGVLRLSKMKDTDIFTSGGYDMVVAITQKSINDQIAHLAKPEVGVIKTEYVPYEI